MPKRERVLEYTDMPKRYKVTYQVYSTYYNELNKLSKGIKVKLGEFREVNEKFLKLADTFSNDPNIYFVYKLISVTNYEEKVIKKLYIYHKTGERKVSE